MAKNSEKSKTSTLEAKHKIAMEILYDDGEWFRLPVFLFRIRPTVTDASGERKIKLKMAGLTLAAMLNQSTAQQAYRLHDGWFRFCAKKAYDHTSFTEKTQYNHIQLLLKCGLIHEPHRAKEYRGQRVLKVNMDMLCDLLLEASESRKSAGNKSLIGKIYRLESRKFSGSNRENLPNLVNKKKQKEEIEEERGGKPPLSPSPSKPSPEKRTKKPVPAGSTKNVRASWKKGTQPHELAAQQLHAALRENSRIITGTSDAVWSVPFKELETTGVPYQKVLTWYCKHCSREDETTLKLPYIQNARQFRQHFDWIAKARDKGMPGKPPKVRNVIDGDGDEFETREEYLW